MKTPRSFLLFAGILFPVLLSAQRYEVVWSDEFDGTALNTAKWSFQYGTGTGDGLDPGWGNAELQYYTDRSQNLVVENGILKIIARREVIANSQYTSARIRSRFKGDWLYGIIKVRAKIPQGRGMWPAIWMLPSDNAYGGWPKSGEIDIMEAKGNEPHKIYGTIHYGFNAPNNANNGGTFTREGASFAEDFHEYEVRWTPGSIQFAVDGVAYYTTSTWFSPNGPYPAPFNRRFHMLLNLAVGGHFGDSPDANTPFPLALEIDYVRVYQDVNVPPVATGLGLGLERTVVAGAPLELPLFVSDNDGQLTSMKWYINGTFFKEEETAGKTAFALNWDRALAGCYDVWIAVRDNDNGRDSIKVSSIKAMDVCGQQAYSGTAVQLPATIPAVHFDRGGSTVSYFDTTPLSNTGGASVFRPEDAVDTRLFSENRWAVTDALPGEWLEYTVQVPEAGTYDVSAVVNRVDSRTKLILFRNNTQAGEFIRFPSNNSEGTSTRTLAGLQLPAGVHVFRLQVDLAPVEILELSFLKAVSNEAALHTPREFDVKAWPNPFNPSTMLSVSLPEAADVRISIADLSGRVVSQTLKSRLPAGSHNIPVNASGWSSGVYFYSVQAGSSVKTGKLVLVK